MSEFLIVFLASVSAGIVLGALLFFVLAVQKALFVQKYNQFISSPDEKTPSPYSIWVTNIADVVSSRLVFHGMQLAKGLKGGAFKQERAIAAAIAKDEAVEGNQVLGYALDAIKPNSFLGKLINKNPEIIGAVTESLKKRGKAVAVGHKDNGGAEFKPFF